MNPHQERWREWPYETSATFVFYEYGAKSSRCSCKMRGLYLASCKKRLFDLDRIY
jgi:hypothetical protein